MNTYILFIYSTFETKESMLLFCQETFPELDERITNIKFIINGIKNIIIIFNSDIEERDLSLKFKDKLTIKEIDYYILFERRGLITSYIPSTINELLFKNNEEKFDMVEIDPHSKDYNLDDILDKISKTGMESLTEEELNYLKTLK